MPTFNRVEAIGLTLEHLAAQTLPMSEFEVVVVDDGSTDDTEEYVTQRSWAFELNYHRRNNSGAATTRNFGVAQSRAPLILFLDSDVVADSRLLELHVESHRGLEDRLIVGRVKPWPEPSRPWYEQVVYAEGGMDYGDTARSVPFYMTLGGNFSIARGVFDAVGGYNQSFPAAGCEETEFAYRAEQAGFSLWYQPEAIGYHNHPRSLYQRCQQQYAHMSSMALLIAMHPQLQTVIFGVDEVMPIFSQPLSFSAARLRFTTAILGLRPIRSALYRSLMLVDQRRLSPRLASMLFWQLIRGWKHAGFHHGLSLYGNHNSTGR